MILRPATPEDQTLLERWDKQPHVMAFAGDDGDFDWAYELPRNVPWREFLVAEVDGRAIGFIQIIDPAEEETRYWGDVAANLRAIDIWIGEADCLNQGYGSEMMRLAFERCFAVPGVFAILIDPLEVNVRARRFYERLGFKFVGRRTFDTDKCAVYRLDRADWQAGTASRPASQG